MKRVWDGERQITCGFVGGYSVGCGFTTRRGLGPRPAAKKRKRRRSGGAARTAMRDQPSDLYGFLRLARTALPWTVAPPLPKGALPSLPLPASLARVEPASDACPLLMKPGTAP